MSKTLELYRVESSHMDINTKTPQVQEIVSFCKLEIALFQLINLMGTFVRDHTHLMYFCRTSLMPSGFFLFTLLVTKQIRLRVFRRKSYNYYNRRLGQKSLTNFYNEEIVMH